MDHFYHRKKKIRILASRLKNLVISLLPYMPNGVAPRQSPNDGVHTLPFPA